MRRVLGLIAGEASRVEPGAVSSAAMYSGLCILLLHQLLVDLLARRFLRRAHAKAKVE